MKSSQRDAIVATALGSRKKVKVMEVMEGRRREITKVRANALASMQEGRDKSRRPIEKTKKRQEWYEDPEVNLGVR
jgi:hypothetical protein